MGKIRDAANAAYADDLVPGTPRKPSKAAIRNLFKTVEDSIADTSGGLLAFETWAELDAFDTEGVSVGQAAKVYEDEGTHTDPVSEATVDNAGVYRLAGEGWERIAELEAEQAREAAEAAEAAATVASEKAQEATDAVTGFPDQVEAAVQEVAETAAGTIADVSIAAIDAATNARLALIQAARNGDIFPNTAAGLSNGAVAIQAIVAGSGGTNGSYDAVISGGGGTGMAIRYVVLGNVLHSAVILNKGYGYTSNPTIALTGSGLTGASIAVTLGALNTVTDTFSTQGSNGDALKVYRVDAGPVATLIGRLEAWEAKALRTLYGRARYDTMVSDGQRPWVEPWPVRMYMGTRTGGMAMNANGTYAMPPASGWQGPRMAQGVFDVSGDRVCYVVATTEVTDAIQISVTRGGTTIKAGSTTTQPSPGVYRQTWNNPLTPQANADLEIRVTNVSSGEIDIYPIEIYPTDYAHFPQIIRFDDTEVVVESRRIIDWNTISPMAIWKATARMMEMLFLNENRITRAYDSVNGNNGNTGDPWSPLKDLTYGTALSSGQTLGLRRGSIWNQSLNALIGSTTKGLAVREYSEGRVFDPLPILDSAIDVTGLTWTDEGSGTWSATVPCDANTIKTGEQNYSFISVVEITLADQLTKPRGCRRLLVPQRVNLVGNVPSANQVSQIAIVMATPGTTLGIFTPGNTSYTLYIHTRDGLAPSASPTYGYRAVNRGSCMDWVQGNTRQAIVCGIDFRQGADGLGIVCGSNQSYFSRIIADGGFKHTLHIEGGTVADFVIGNKGASPNAFGDSANAGNCYISPNANGFAWKWTRGYAFDCWSAIYSHAAAGKYTQGEISYVWVIRERETPTGSLCVGDPMASSQVSATEECWTYIQGHAGNGRVGSNLDPSNSYSHHNLARKISRTDSRKLTKNNIYQLQPWGGAAVGDRSTRGVRLKEDHKVQNNLYHIITVPTDVADYSTQGIEVIASGNNNPDFSKNMLAFENTLGTASVLVAESAAGLTWTSDYNYIAFCVPGAFSSTKFGTGSKSTVADYLAFFPGHDVNSLFEDLRDDPRRMKAVWMDPVNGNYCWAQTRKGARAKAYCELYGVGPDHVTIGFPYIPTYDEVCNALIAA